MPARFKFFRKSLESTEVGFSNLATGLLIRWIAEVNPATQRSRRRGAEVFLLKGTELIGNRLLKRRCRLQQYFSFKPADEQRVSKFFESTAPARGIALRTDGGNGSIDLGIQGEDTVMEFGIHYWLISWQLIT